MPVIETIERETIRYEAPSLETRAPPDPFWCDDPCPNNGGAPHQFIWSCGVHFCPHCSKVVWS